MNNKQSGLWYYWGSMAIGFVSGVLYLTAVQLYIPLSLSYSIDTS